MSTIRRCCALTTLAAGLSLPALASAQNVEHAFQLGLETGLLTHTSASLQYDTGANTHVDHDTSTTQWGVGNQDVFLVLGYGLTQDLVLGGAVQLGGTSESDDVGAGGNVDTSQMTVGLLPRIEYMFMNGNKVRPFLRGQLILRHTSVGLDNNNDYGVTQYGLGGGGGVRWFADPALSFDASLGLNLVGASGSYDVANTSRDISGSAWMIGLNVGVAGWL